MITYKQRIALAEKCGWEKKTLESECGGTYWQSLKTGERIHGKLRILDYFRPETDANDAELLARTIRDDLQTITYVDLAEPDWKNKLCWRAVNLWKIEP